VKVGDAGRVWLWNAVGTVEVVADIAGYYIAGGAGPKGDPGLDAAAPVFTTALVNATVGGGAGPTTVASLTLAEGTYLLEANVQLSATTATPIECTIGSRAVTVQVAIPVNLMHLVGDFVLNAAGDV